MLGLGLGVSLGLVPVADGVAEARVPTGVGVAPVPSGVAVTIFGVSVGQRVLVGARVRSPVGNGMIVMVIATVGNGVSVGKVAVACCGAVEALPTSRKTAISA